MRDVIETSAGLLAIVDRQHQVVTRQQLNGEGVDDMAIYRRIRYGGWQRALPGIYVVRGGSLGTEQRRVAAALYAGENAQLTGAAALTWHGFRYCPATNVTQVLVPHETRRRSTGFVVVSRTRELDSSARYRDLYAVCSPARAVIDACRSGLDLRSARAVMAEAVHRSFTSLDSLDEEIRRAARSRTALARRVHGELVAGVRSSPEADLRDLASTSKILPPMLCNPRLYAPDGTVLPTPDGFIEEVGMALEVDSREYHADDAGWAETLRRHNLLTQYGAIVLHFTPREIRGEGPRVLETMERTYLSRLASPVTVTLLVGAPYAS